MSMRLLTRMRGGGTASVPASEFEWQIFPLGAGGFITSLQILPTGQASAKLDAHGVVFKEDMSVGVDVEPWRQVITNAGMPEGEWGHDENGNFTHAGLPGGYGVARSQSNPDVAYVILLGPTDGVGQGDGYLYKTVNASAAVPTFTRTNYPATPLDPNDGTRLTGPRIAIDFDDPDHVVVGSPSGAQRTLDGGESWAALADVLAPTGTYGVVVAQDPSNHDIWYAWPEGRGVWRSTNNAANFTAETGDPLSPRSISIGADGVVMACAQAGGAQNLWRRTAAGVWSQRTNVVSNEQWISAAPDLDSPGVWYVAEDGGSVCYTSDDFTNTTARFAPSWTSALIPWHEWIDEGYIATSQIVMFDGDLFYSTGISIGKATNPPTTAVGFDLESIGAGIEELIAMDAVWIPGIGVGIPTQDRVFFLKKNADFDDFPEEYAPDNNEIIRHCANVAIAASDPNCLVGYFEGDAEAVFFTTNANNATPTWTRKAFPVPGSAVMTGGIAAVTPSKWMLTCGIDGFIPQYTDDQGDTYNDVTSDSPGLPAGAGDNGWGYLPSQGMSRSIVAADWVTANKFYLYNNGEDESDARAGIWAGTNGHVAQVYAGIPPVTGTGAFNDRATMNFNAKLKTVPLNAGHLFLTGCEVQSNTPPGFSGALMYSTNGGPDLDAVPDVLEALGVGFGAPDPDGGGYPAIYIVANIGGATPANYGVYMCTNGHLAPASWTWTKLADFPLGIVINVAGCCGTDEFGECVVALKGYGAVIYRKIS